MVVVLCSDYERKDWCGGVEWRAIRNLIKRREGDIIFLRADEGEVSGTFSLDGYLDMRRLSDDELISLISERVTKARETASSN